MKEMVTKGVLTLVNPLLVNGSKVETLEYDTNEITASMFAAADVQKMRAASGGNLSGAVELDYALHLYLGFAAITALNPEIDIADLERIKGADVTAVMRVGRDFIMGSAVASAGASCGELSGTMRERSTRASQTSDEND